MEKDKYFMWYDSDDRRQHPTYGPHYSSDIKIVGGAKCYHSLEQMLQMNISDSLKKRLINCKIGTKIKIHYLHSEGDLMVKCISSKEVVILDEYMENNNKIKSLEEQVRKIESEQIILIKKLGFDISNNYGN